MTIYSDLLDAYQEVKASLNGKVDKANDEGAAAKALFAYKAEADKDGNIIDETYLKLDAFDEYREEIGQALSDIDGVLDDHAEFIEDHELRISTVEQDFLPRAEAQETFALLSYYPNLTDDYASKTILDYINDENDAQNEEISARAMLSFYPDLDVKLGNQYVPDSDIVDYIQLLHQNHENRISTNESHIATLDRAAGSASQSISNLEGRMTTAEGEINTTKTNLAQNYYTKTDSDNRYYTRTESDDKFALKQYYPNLGGSYANKTVLDYVDDSIGLINQNLLTYYETKNETDNRIDAKLQGFKTTNVDPLARSISDLEDNKLDALDAQVLYAKKQYYTDDIGMPIIQYLTQNYVRINDLDPESGGFNFITGDEVRDMLTQYMTRTELANTYLTKTNAVELFVSREDVEQILDGHGLNPENFVSKSDYEADKDTFATKTELAELADQVEGYVTEQDLEDAVENLVSQNDFAAFIDQYAEDKQTFVSTSVLEDYVTTNDFGEFQDQYAEDLTALATKAELQDLDDAKLDKDDYLADKAEFITQSDLVNNYVQSATYNAFVTQYNTEKENWVTNEDLTTLLADFVTANDVTAMLADYASSSDLIDAIDDLSNTYATLSDLDRVEQSIPANLSDLTNDAGFLTDSDIASGSTDGTISVNGTDVAVTGLGSAAFADTTDFADATHEHDSSEITSLSNYSKPLSTSAIATTDTLDEALGKLEAALDNIPVGNFVPVAGARGNLAGHHTADVQTLPNNGTATITINSSDTTIIDINAIATIAFTAGTATETATKVVCLRNPNGALSALNFTGVTWANNDGSTTWGRNQNSTLILVASFIAGAVYMSVFHNSEA